MLEGFSASGHGTLNSEDEEGRIICAAVSSAVYMTANTLSEIVGAGLNIEDSGEVFSLKISSKLEESQVVMEGLKLHLTALSEDYKHTIKIISEV